MSTETKERRKPGRRRKKRVNESRVVKLSADVYNHITTGKGKVSVDHALRTLLDLPLRNGKKKKVKIKYYWGLLGESLWLGRTQREARGEAILRQVQTGDEETPVKMREVG